VGTRVFILSTPPLGSILGLEYKKGKRFDFEIYDDVGCSPTKKNR